MNTLGSMDRVNELTKFEEFPAEIFHIIFDYLSGDDILRSFLYLNKRFNSLTKQLRLNTVEISAWTCRDITSFFKNVSNYISLHCHSFKLTNQHSRTGSCSANIEFILSTVLDSYQLKCLLKNLQQLIYIRPIIDTAICLPDIILQSFIVHSFVDKIIFRKTFSHDKLDCLMICSNTVMRTLLVDHGGIYNQMLVSYQNPIIQTIISYVKHLKLYIDNYNRQWVYMSPFVVDTLSELTLLIIDDQFEYYHGQLFSSLLSNIADKCHIHFFLQFIPSNLIINYDIDILAQSFQNEFYTQHQANVTIAYCRNFSLGEGFPLLIYTSPFCASKITLINNQNIIGVCSDYRSLTRLIFDPCFPNYPSIIPSSNQINCLTNLTSLELIHTPRYNFNRMAIPSNTILRQVISNIRHIHFISDQCSSYLIKYILPLYKFQCLRYLDITNNDLNCSILNDILHQSDFCANIFHLNISGLCCLRDVHIKEIGLKFPKLQTLKFSMKFISSFNEQLDTIGQSILIKMRSHLHYLHIYFQYENLLIMSMIPSESQLSEWLGYNQKRLLHVQAIELNRNELSAWL
ncbi:unnamed protein product [Rotaria socialis]|uniref:F-box domain-containing protein n=1 Tax=Rotaria socialis TaxID=392032 RepID=A0A820RWB8_9BILA|nr:unnamed protein product [Rotaria socialis]CAF4444120.1 unnamed protein product [Rotaria socialis]